MDQKTHDLTVVLFGNSSAVHFGDENILFGKSPTGNADFSQTVPEPRKISGHSLSVINLLDLQENELYLDSVGQTIDRLARENEIHFFIFVLQLGQLTDSDKGGIEWLQNLFGEDVLPFTIILFTYEREEDSDTIIDDLKKSPVLEQLLKKCGHRYHTCSKSMNNRSEIRTLLEKINLMVCERSTASSLRKALQDRKRQQSACNSNPQEDKMGSTKKRSKSTTQGFSLSSMWKDIKKLNCFRSNTFPSHDPMTDSASSRQQHSEEKSRAILSQKDHLFERLQLKEFEKQKLKPADVLQITAQSVVCKQSCSEEELVQTFLQKLLLVDYRARCIPIKEAASEVDRVQSSAENIREDEAFSHFINKKKETTKNDLVHPMDVQMAVFHCSDNFLKQLIVTKLSQCQYALPLLVPDPFTGEIEFPLWAFRQIKKSWKSTDMSGMISNNSMPVYNAENPMVAFFRIGLISRSKSKLINDLINEKHNTFFHRDCQGSSTHRLLMDGVVEIAWYCPSGKSTDHFTDCVAFCNLHGEAETLEKQLEILTEMSSVNVVVLGDNITNNAILQKLFKGPKPLVCLLCEDDSCISGSGNLKFKLGLKGRNQAAVSEELRNTIKECLTNQPSPFRLEDVRLKSTITTDENNPECKQGKEAALQMIRLLEGMDLCEIKRTYLPCQGKLWREWCKKNKEQYRLHGTNLEKESSEKHKEMDQIREQQYKQGLTNLTELFIRTMNSGSPVKNDYFHKWVEILLDKLTADGLSALHNEYDEKWSKVLNLKRKHVKSEQMKDEQTELEMISEKLQAATFGLEHILREMAQLYESFISVQTDDKGCKDEVFSSLPKLAAELLKTGHPLELMDGDAAHVPLVWVSAVLDELSNKLGDQRVFVLSVLGIQSSGKSTMLNAMFGLQFAVSAGRCTRGAFMQLVKVSEEMKEELKFDYILVVDTEGLRALELAGKDTIHHDNELATFVVGLGNMTLINIFGENPSEMQDILQIVVQAFMRMKKVRLNPSCVFVHQNVTDVAAGEKNMEGRRRLQDRLDEMTKLAAKDEVCDVECFSDVIAFDVQKDVKYFSQLWEGSPPMAPPNPRYSENVQELKRDIVSRASETNCMKLSQFQQRVKDLWEALLNENFVFSFRNTLEISVYRKLEVEYEKWTWSLRSTMLSIEDKMLNRISSGKVKAVGKEELMREMSETLQKVQISFKKYFEEDSEKETLIQWKSRFETQIQHLHDDLVDEAKRKLDENIKQKSIRKNMDKQLKNHENTLFEKSKELALKLKEKSKNRDTKAEFNSVWKKWVSDLTEDVPKIKAVNISEDVLKIQGELYECGLVVDRKESAAYSKIHTVADYSSYVSMKSKKFGPVNLWKKSLKPEDQISIRELITNIIQQTTEKVESFPVSVQGYRAGYIQQTVHDVKQRVQEFKPIDDSFEFKKEFFVDLSLCVCEQAEKRFVELHRKYRETNDPILHFKKKKIEYFNVFENYWKGATSAAVLGDQICVKLKGAILQSVYNMTAKFICDQMRGKPPFNGNRGDLEKHFLKSLAEQEGDKEEKFNNFLTYMNHPRTYFEKFIKLKVNERMAAENPQTVSAIKEHIDHKQRIIISAAEKARDKVKLIGGDVNVWMVIFSNSLVDELGDTRVHLSGNVTKDVTDYDVLVDVMKKELLIVVEELKKSLCKLSNLRKEMFRIKPEEILIKHFCRCCWKQCPFCGAVCTNSQKNHTGDHQAEFHRSGGMNGWHYRGTTEFAIDFCTTAVASDKSFYPRSDSEFSVPYKQYRRAGGEYAKWLISTDFSELVYWKWFVCEFQENLETYHNKTFTGNGKIPSNWKFTQSDAVASLGINK